MTMTATSSLSLVDWEKAEAVQRYWNDHYRDLLEEYPEEFVAMQDERVVASHSSLPALIDILHQHGIDVARDVSIRFITRTWATLNL
jgi:hypothetical protein